MTNRFSRHDVLKASTAAAAVQALDWPSGIYNVCEDGSSGADNRRARAAGW